MMFEKKDQIIVSSRTGRDVVDVKFFYRYVIPTGLNAIKFDILNLYSNFCRVMMMVPLGILYR